jgi:Zn-dependent protease
MDAGAIRSIVERHFRVYEHREEKVGGETAALLYFVMFPQPEFDVRYESVRQEVRKIDPDLLVFMRREGGEDVLFIAPRPRGPPRSDRLNVVLLILTLITTTTAGAVFWEGYRHAGDPWRWSVFWDPVNLFWGSITFAIPLMLILGVHETAHFLAARRHGLRATLPYFIPVPPILFFPIGTFGAFIRLQDPVPDRKALFDVGASGPLAGFILAVPLLILGTVLTDAAGIDVPDLDRPELLIEVADAEFSDNGPGVAEATWATTGVVLWTVTAPGDPGSEWEGVVVATTRGGDGREERSTIRLDGGATHRGTFAVPADATQATLRVEWDDHLVSFGDPLLVMGVEAVLGPGEYLTHPTFFAAWVGILVTGINLLPAGQLDGGHVARAVLGERARLAALASMGLLLFLAFQFSSWILIALFLVFTGIQHPPPLNDRTPLDVRRKVVAALVLVVFVVTLVPVPLST